MPIELGTPDAKVPASAGGQRGFSLAALKMGHAGTTPVPLHQRTAFNDQLALLLETGVPLHTALGELVGQADSKDVAQILSAVRDDVLDGTPLANALALHPRMFDSTYVNVIASGEAGGFLPKALKQLLELDERSQRLRNVVVSAFTYPLVLLAVSVLVVAFVLLWVFPRFAEMFASMGDKLPFLTMMLMRLSNFLRDNWVAVLASLGAAGGFALHSLRQPATQARLDTLLLGLPVLGPVLCQVHLVPTLRVISLSLGNGVPMVKALGAAREVTASPSFRALIDRVLESVQEGQPVSKVFRASPLLPPLSREMIATGEATGNLAMVMEKLCNHYERDLEQRLQTLSKLVEPLMLLAMSVVIGGIVSALILPIFKMASSAH